MATATEVVEEAEEGFQMVPEGQELEEEAEEWSYDLVDKVQSFSRAMVSRP